MYHVILVGRARDVFAELKRLAFWERYGIGCKIFSISVICLN